MYFLELKYRQLFATLLLCAYLVGSLSTPLFEGVHFLFHLGDDTTLHSFQSHNIQHQHRILNSLDKLVTTSPTTDFPTESIGEKNFKKIVQQLEISTFLSLTDLFSNTSNYTTSFMAYQTPFIQLNSPPPEV